jgi:hypothetical protein
MSLVERLKQLPPTKLVPRSPAPDDEIDEIESATGFTLPPDLRELLAWSNGLEIKSSKTGFSMYDASDLAYTSSEPHFEEDLPGMLILGSDNGGSVYYADPNNQIGRGAWAVYLVRMSEAGIPHSIFVGASFTDAIDTLLAETDLYKRPELGASTP